MGRQRVNTFLNCNRYDPETGCWNWTGTKKPKGYGLIRYSGKAVSAHRLSAHFYLGFDLHSPLHVLHRCDNPPCFNPKHLFIGTNYDNQADSVKKGRHGGMKKTHCKRGHELCGSNLRSTSNPNHRRCRICWNITRANWRLRRGGDGKVKV